MRAVPSPVGRVTRRRKCAAPRERLAGWGEGEARAPHQTAAARSEQYNHSTSTVYSTPTRTSLRLRKLGAALSAV